MRNGTIIVLYTRNLHNSVYGRSDLQVLGTVQLISPRIVCYHTGKEEFTLTFHLPPHPLNIKAALIIELQSAMALE
jgi:hypothetical protein